MALLEISTVFMPKRKTMELRTGCCLAYETAYGDVIVCRKCGMENPELVEVKEEDNGNDTTRARS